MKPRVLADVDFQMLVVGLMDEGELYVNMDVREKDNLPSHGGSMPSPDKYKHADQVFGGEPDPRVGYFMGIYLDILKMSLKENGDILVLEFPCGNVFKGNVIEDPNRAAFYKDKLGELVITAMGTNVLE
jgi:hypothetical protein